MSWPLAFKTANLIQWNKDSDRVKQTEERQRRWLKHRLLIFNVKLLNLCCENTYKCQCHQPKKQHPFTFLVIILVRFLFCYFKACIHICIIVCVNCLLFACICKDLKWLIDQIGGLFRCDMIGFTSLRLWSVFLLLA